MAIQVKKCILAIAATLTTVSLASAQGQADKGDTVRMPALVPIGQRGTFPNPAAPQVRQDMRAAATNSTTSATTAVTASAPPCDCQTNCFCVPPTAAPCAFGSVEYLLWWLSDGSTPPLVSTGNPADTFPGAIGQPGTQVLFGGPNALQFGTFSGLRATVGFWLGQDQDWGVELSGFLLERRAVQFASASDAAGNPPIYVPFENFNPSTPPTPHEGSFTVADPIQFGGTAGNIAYSASTQLWARKRMACSGARAPTSAMA